MSRHLQKLLYAPKDLRVCKLNYSIFVARKKNISYESKVTHAACEKNKATTFPERVHMAMKFFNTIPLAVTPITLRRIYATHDLTFSLVTMYFTFKYHTPYKLFLLTNRDIIAYHRSP